MSRRAAYAAIALGNGVVTVAVALVVFRYPDVFQALSALELLRVAPAPEAIILDLNLPRMDGRELLGAIRRDPRLCQLAVVVLSTSHYDADIDTCRRFGVRSYVIKPARFDEFVEVARRIGRLCGELRC